MELGSFTETLRDLSADDIRSLAAELASVDRSVDDEISAMRAVIAIDAALRGVRLRGLAANAARGAAEAVVGAARRRGMALPDDDVTRVARAAAVLARGIVAGPAAHDDVRLLAQAWAHVRVGSALAAA
jgi:hypothetical protein